MIPYIYRILFLLSLLSLTQTTGAQDISFSFDNAEITAEGPFGSYEVDVMVSTTTAFKLGAGQLYFNYNTAAFGSSVIANARVTLTTTDHILGETSGPFGIYSSFVVNDNTTSRFSYSWQQALSSGCFSNNVTTSTEVLFHLRIDYISGGSAQDPMLCFESSGVFEDQTFTACGPDGSCAFTDCAATPGTQITNDSYDCTNSALPVELLDFYLDQQKLDQVDLYWTTVSESNSSHFEIERSEDAQQWTTLGQAPAAGFSSSPQHYQFSDNSLYSFSNTTLYYRLRMVDLDGSFDYSLIRAIDWHSEDRGEASLLVFPNPASEGLYIKLRGEEWKSKVQIRLLDVQGRQVLNKLADIPAGAYFLQWDRALKSGIYYLHLRSRNGNWSHKVVISR